MRAKSRANKSSRVIAGAPIIVEPEPVVVSSARPWLREKTPADAAIVSDNPALIYLYTGRKTMTGERAEERWEDWKRHNVRYMARLSIYQIPDPGLADGRFNQAYRSKGPLKLRVVDFGPRATRRSWNAFGLSGQMRLDDLK